MKNCPYCGEEIQDLAKKCRYCGEWLKKEEKNCESQGKEMVKKKTPLKWVIIPIILIILVLIGVYSLSNKINKESETWQGFYYPNGLSEGTEISGPIFNNFKACQDWALSKYNDGKEAYCSKNCHDSVDGTPICEDVVRTRHPLPGFGNIFEGIPENRETSKSCNIPTNDYNKGYQFNKGYEHAKNGGTCDVSTDEDFHQGCSFYLLDARNYMSCKNDCEIYEEYGDDWFECISEGDAWKDVLKSDQVPSNITSNSSCPEPFNDYEIGSEGYRGFEYAKNGGECDYTQPLTSFNDACDYYKHEYVRYVSCLNGCTVPRNPYNRKDEKASYQGWEHALIGVGCSGKEWENGFKNSPAYAVGCDRFYSDNEDFIKCFIN